MSLYDVLGVEKTASQADIKKAYHRKAQKQHPDHGGSDNEIRALTHAYGVLSDDEKRKHYDETGEETPAEDPFEAAAKDFFFQLCRQILIDPDGDDVNIKLSLQRTKAQCDSQNAQRRRELNQQRGKLERAKKRIINHPNVDLIGSLIDQGLREVATAGGKLEQLEKVQAKAFAMFEGYEFTEPPEQPMAMSQFGYMLNGQIFMTNQTGAM